MDHAVTYVGPQACDVKGRSEVTDGYILDASDHSQAYRNCADHVSKLVDSLGVQLFIFVLVISHSALYWRDWDGEELDDGDLRKLLIYASATGIPLVVLTISEFLTRVWGQSSKNSLCKLQSWIEFVQPFFHRLEVVVLICHLYSNLKAGHDVIVCVSDTDYRDKVHSADRLTVLVAIFYRIFRWWGISLGVSVKSSYNKELKRQSNARWMLDHKDEKSRNKKRLLVRLQDTTDTKLFQFALVALVLFHCLFYGAPRTWPDTFGNFYGFSKITGYTSLGVFSFEFWVRVTAQGGEPFFGPTLHKAEIVALMIGLFLVGYATWWHESIWDTQRSFEPAVGATAFVLLTHRLLRGIGIFYDVSGSVWHSESLTAAIACRRFLAKYEDILEVPPQNVSIGSQHLLLQKAKLKPAAFEKLHMPFRICDGLIEELMLHFPNPLDPKPTSAMSIQNLLLIVGPGSGLAEAGGLDDSKEQAYWTYDSVVEAKAKLCELIFKRLHAKIKRAAPADPPPVRSNAVSGRFVGSTYTSESDVTGTSNSAEGECENLRTATNGIKGRVFSLMHALRKRGQRCLKALKKKVVALAKHNSLEIIVENVVIEFEDKFGTLEHGAMSAGLRVGTLSIIRRGRRSKTPQHLALRVAATPGGPGTWDVHMASMRVVLHEPLYLKLMRDFLKPRHRLKKMGQVFAVPTQEVCIRETAPAVSVANIDFNARSGHMTMTNGRPIGFMKVKHTENYMIFRGGIEESMSEHAQNVRTARRNLRRLNQVRRKFDLACGMAGGIAQRWSMNFHFGAFHFVQAGACVSDSIVLVEEYRWRAFILKTSASNRGSLQTEKLMTVEVGSFDDSKLAPWYSAEWNKECCSPFNHVEPQFSSGDKEDAVIIMHPSLGMRPEWIVLDRFCQIAADSTKELGTNCELVVRCVPRTLYRERWLIRESWKWQSSLLPVGGDALGEADFQKNVSVNSSRASSVRFTHRMYL